MMSKVNRPSKSPIYVAVLFAVTIVLFFFFDKEGYTQRLLKLVNNSNDYDYVRFLDVGQADCTLIKSGDKYALIDAGNLVDDGFNLEKKLLSYGVKRIEFILISHLHSDHAGGIGRIISNFDVDSIYYPSVCDMDDDIYKEAKRIANDKIINIYHLNKGDKIHMDDSLFEVIWLDDYAYENDSSLVLSLKSNGMSFYFGGDVSTTVERKMLKADVLQDFDVIKASHHGSKTSNCGEFLDAVSPEYCIAFCGIDNAYNFPSDEFLERINSRDINMFTTAQNGDITFNTEKREILLQKTNATYQR